MPGVCNVDDAEANLDLGGSVLPLRRAAASDDDVATHVEGVSRHEPS